MEGETGGAAGNAQSSEVIDVDGGGDVDDSGGGDGVNGSGGGGVYGKGVDVSGFADGSGGGGVDGSSLGGLSHDTSLLQDNLL